MSKVVRDYIKERSARDNEFAREIEGYEDRYEAFKLNAMLKEMRTESGLTLQELADRIGSKRSTLSRMENHAEDVRFSTIQRIAKACGKKVEIVFV